MLQTPLLLNSLLNMLLNMLLLLLLQDSTHQPILAQSSPNKVTNPLLANNQEVTNQEATNPKATNPPATHKEDNDKNKIIYIKE